MLLKKLSIDQTFDNFFFFFRFDPFPLIMLMLYFEAEILQYIRDDKSRCAGVDSVRSLPISIGSGLE